METQGHPGAAPTLDYAPPARPAVSWSELWTYREPVLIQHPRFTWRIALVLVLLYALTPVFVQGGYDMRMLHSMGLTALWWAFVARLVLDTLVVLARFLESGQTPGTSGREAR